MSDPSLDQTEMLVRRERSGIWLALVVVLLLAGALLLGRAAPNHAHALMTLLPVGIVFGVAWLGRMKRGIRSDQLQENRKAVMHDELRQVAMHRACKTAFMTMLGGLGVFCVLRAAMDLACSAQLLAAIMIALGATVFLVAFLCFDRA